jgi:subtilase family serine protease
MKKAFGWTILAFLAVALSFVGASAFQQPLIRPDLVVTGIDFQKVQSGTDSEGKTYWIFNVTAKIKNQGNGNAGAFKVLIERNNGAGGAWQTACPTCTIDVGGLAAGQEMTSAPRQFNNANGAPSKFRFTADSGKQVGESNENNNSREEAFIALSIGEVPGGGIPHLAKPDLTIVSWNFQDVISTIVDGKVVISFKLAATVKNQGPGAAPASKLHFLGSAECKVSFKYVICDVPALSNGGQTLIVSEPQSFVVGTSIYSYYYPVIDYENKIAETNETNNQKGCERIPGVK